MTAVAVIKTGVANTASVLAGLRRIGADPTLTESVDAVRSARAVVLPGVGAFAAGMQRISELNLAGAIRDRVVAGQPTLAVCVGLQLLCEQSEENPGVEGLGAVAAKVTRFAQTVKVPQLGWNQVKPNADCKLLESGYAYFANSYRVEQAPLGWSPAFTDHGGEFVAAFERGAVLACQFHPELSGEWGINLLRRWLAAC